MGYTAQDLFKTKICEYYKEGRCPRDKCTFAHGEGELRRLPPQRGRPVRLGCRGLLVTSAAQRDALYDAYLVQV